MRALLKSSLRLPQSRAPYQTYPCQGIIIPSLSCPRECWLYVGGLRLPKKTPASFGKEEAPAGRTCTPPGHHFTSLTLLKNSPNSTARIGHVAWVPTSLPNSIVLLGGRDDAAELTAEIVPGFAKWSSFQLFFVVGGGTFALRHSGEWACGIPDEDTIVMTGGYRHQYVTRWLPSSSPLSSCKKAGIKTIFLS